METEKYLDKLFPLGLIFTTGFGILSHFSMSTSAPVRTTYRLLLLAKFQIYDFLEYPRVCSVLFSIVITSLGKERADLFAFRAFVCLFCTCQFLFFFSSSWCQGLAAVCDCGAPWNFLLTVFVTYEAIRITICSDVDRSHDLAHAKPALYCIAIKAGLYSKAEQLCCIPNTTTFILTG